MKKPWLAWVHFTSEQGDVRVLGWTQFALCALMAFDLSILWINDIVPTLYLTLPAGGIARGTAAPYVLDNLFPTSEAGPAAYVVTTIAYACAAIGIWPRITSLLAITLHAQLAYLVPEADVAIDRVIRAVLLILLFSDAHQSRFPGWRGPVIGNRWPIDLIRLQLVLVYMGPGVAKCINDAGWWSYSDHNPLVTIVGDPISGRLDGETALAFAVPLFLLGVGSVLLELSAFLLLTRWRAAWASFGLLLHVGIALTMNIGIFSYAMLALYPLIFHGTGVWDRAGRVVRWARTKFS